MSHTCKVKSFSIVQVKISDLKNALSLHVNSKRRTCSRTQKNALGAEKIVRSAVSRMLDL